MKIDRRRVDREPLIAWIGQQPQGATTKQIMEHVGWRSAETAWEVLHGLVLQGRLCQHGRTTRARWCTPLTLPAVIAWSEQLDAEQIEREDERKLAQERSRSEPSIPRVASIFDYAGTFR